MTTDEKCPMCQSALFYRVTKRGDFVGCTGYPKCSYHRPLRRDEYGDFNHYLNTKKRHPKIKPSVVGSSSLPQRSCLDMQSID